MITRLYNIHRARIIELCPFAEVIHVGSTAIKGFPTKGDLDINVRVLEEDFQRALELLKNDYIEKLGTLQCDVLRYLIPIINNEKFDIGIQVTIFGSEYDMFCLFNELLRFNASISDAYSQIKARYGKIPDDEYRKEKTDVISRSLASVKRLVIS